VIDRSVFEVATPETDKSFTKFCIDWDLNPVKVEANIVTKSVKGGGGAIVIEKPSFIVINGLIPR
jgi:hypothetical protein